MIIIDMKREQWAGGKYVHEILMNPIIIIFKKTFMSFIGTICELGKVKSVLAHLNIKYFDT